MQHTVAGHRNSEVVIVHLTVVLKLEDDVDVIAFLDLDGDDIAVFVESVDRNYRIVHFMRKTRQVKAHDLVDASHRIIGIALKSQIIYGDILSIKKNLLFASKTLVSSAIDEAFSLISFTV